MGEPYPDVVEPVIDQVDLVLGARPDIGHGVVFHRHGEHDDELVLGLLGRRDLREGEAGIVFGDADRLRPHLPRQRLDLVRGGRGVGDFGAGGVDPGVPLRLQDLVPDEQMPLGRRREALAEMRHAGLVHAADAGAPRAGGVGDVDGSHSTVRHGFTRAPL